MPQMAPLMWLMLFFFFIIMLIMMMTMIFFMKNYMQKNMNFLNKKIKMNWKW